MEDVLRLSSLVASLVPVAEALPHRHSGPEVHLQFRLVAGSDRALEDLRGRLERPAATALGAALTRAWPPVKHGTEVWTLAVHRERAGLLADALAIRTLYPLVLVYQSAWELERIAPAVAEGEPEIGVHDVADIRHRRPSPHYLRLLSAVQLDEIDKALRESEERDAKGPFPGLWARSALGGGTAVLREAVRQARLTPLERAA